MVTNSVGDGKKKRSLVIVVKQEEHTKFIHEIGVGGEIKMSAAEWGGGGGEKLLPSFSVKNPLSRRYSSQWNLFQHNNK